MIPRNYSEAQSELAKRMERKENKQAKRRLMGCEASQDAPGRTKRRKKSPSRKDQVKKIKKRILGPGGSWSIEVRARDGACVMCGKTEGLQAHHWLFRRGHSMALAVDIRNGATLCYGCHIGRVHHDGDGDLIFRLGDKMTSIVGAEAVAEMRALSLKHEPLDLEWWQAAEEKLLTLKASRAQQAEDDRMGR